MEKELLSLETIVGLQVKDDDLYTKYRTEMKSLLETYEGGFRYDFKIQETLKSETKNPINRVFLIYFKNKERKLSFFSDPEYKKIREKYFVPSVESTTQIAEYERFSDSN
ncbi:DUF1330 domain-containing protein [Leptospira sp. 2 VSF19]|uniref:DUF1330 domain-containing protein n=1 Tax=Leptospira soteropolitanensis TaxID=2950025 RepID=A0AAW5VDT8_9LEPT|nr:DUF1330 domain-containing protein [Leptospira soteropolitanensis]MCW7491838.1 DUF1330 domain-containing protein [Leptospira soteropolitanensis]MCW7499422.1 DUF1330 domain-containing protein [Leptospira soteropolitanensis]MCW7520987.1 DUF1330 domain-containing protein [Leptospira soteropolitanensis]MCW7525526.1 DUF1330 domain-containing protein [Leptospira soteropolitanensis]MCW7529392.1 DUF1330 domain-containing protein [Leptospira soteropolitanensis]